MAVGRSTVLLQIIVLILAMTPAHAGSPSVSIRTAGNALNFTIDDRAATRYAGRYEGHLLVAYPGQPVGELQSVPTKTAKDWESFKIADQHYLVVANEKSGTGATSYDQDSIIYKYDATRTTDPFQPFQSIPTKGASDWEHFQIGSLHFLVVANFISVTHSVDSVIYQYDPTRGVDPFVAHQHIPTVGARSWESFQIGDASFLAVANCQGDGAAASVSNQDSKIYKYDTTEKFELLQSIPTFCGNKWKYVQIGSKHFLAVSNGRSGTTDQGTYEQNSIVYEYDETQTTNPFQLRQSIPTVGSFDLEFFQMGSATFLGVANCLNIQSNVKKYKQTSKIYKYDTSRTTDPFVEVQSIATVGAAGEFFFF